MSEKPTPVFYNTLTREKQPFNPIEPDNVRMYVCGPTVYDYAHIGNARPAIVFDVLYRLLRHRYGADNVTYVRNITDVDDKINARALRDHGDAIASGTMTLNEAIREVTERTYAQYKDDVAALGCLEPTHQPRATEHIDGMVAIIQKLLDNANAYIAAGAEGREVLFDVASDDDYGILSNRKLEDQQAGARVEAKDHKKNPGDFVLWKESAADQPGWNGEFLFGSERLTIHGRPGWHIECSAMSEAFLGKTFDIHGGGLDLIFPHHENEIAQSCSAHGTNQMANIWMHNGYLQVEGKKMSKSEGNFVTIHDLLHTDKFGGRKWPGQVLRLAMLMTHYREPIDFSEARLNEAQTIWLRWGRLRRAMSDTDQSAMNEILHAPSITPDIASLISDDLNVGSAIQRLNREGRTAEAGDLKLAAKVLRNLVALGFELLDSSFETHVPETEIQVRIDERLALLKEKNFAEADKIRDELLAQGIQLKDSKNAETGERITTWEVKR